MVRTKLQKQQAANTDPRITRGLFAQDILFPEADKIVLELACGRGEYTVGLAQHSPEVLHIGVDQKGDRIAVGSQKARMIGLDNVRFIWGIIHNIERWIAPHSIDDIWIIQPDPRPKDHDEKRRLTHPRFLRIYENILKSGGTVRLKTDDDDLFRYSLASCEAAGRICVRQTDDLYQSSLREEHYDIQTFYEKRALSAGKKICYAVWMKKTLG